MTQPIVNHSRSIGTLMILFNSIWLYTGIERLYGQNYGGILYLFTYPNWLIITAMICSIAGILLGIFVLKKRIKTQHGILINIALIIIYSFLNLYVT